MIVSHKLRFVYIGPPKTASTTLHWWLSQPALCDSRWESDWDHQHDTSIPPEARDYFRLASIREPLDRAVSMWQHKRADCDRLSVRPLEFAEFMAWLPVSDWFYSKRQSDYLRGLWPDAIVRFDRLESDLLSLPFIASIPRQNLEPIPKLNPTQHAASDSYYTPWLRQAAEGYFAEDLDLWKKLNGS